MNIFENIKMAFVSIADNKLRSFLTMISIIIGIASVIAIVSIGRGATGSLVSNVLEATNGRMMIEYKPKNAEDDMYGFSTEIADDANIYVQRQIDAVLDIPGVKAVELSNSSGQVNASYKDNELKNKSLQTIYNTDSFEKDFDIVQGRVFSEKEMSMGIPHMMIHEKTAERFFGNDSAIGKEIIMGGKIFEVVGTYKEKPMKGGMNVSMVSENFYIPFNAWISFSGKQEIQSLSIVPDPAQDLKVLGKKVEEVLNATKYESNEGKYTVMNFDVFVNQMTQTMDIMTLFISMIAAISLVVGGIGVMNIMYVSVVERTQEIGLRKALGASGNQVLIQFLIESITITTIGGIIGVALGLLGNAIGAMAIDYTFKLYPDVIGLGVGFAALIGLVFGTFPAAKASKMQPIEALRSL